MLSMWLARYRRILGWVLAAASGCLSILGPLRAQTVPAQQSPGGTYTLHAYTDLLQVPTLVLTRLHSSYRSLTTQSFTVSLNGGPAFHPANVRLEGDDPITLGIIFDLTTDSSGMFRSFANAMKTLRPGVFTPRDYLSVYAYDCELVRTTEDQSATPEHLQDAMTKVMTVGKERARNGEEQSCWSQKRLYDVLGRVIEDIGKLPGRRVILVISDGADRHSVNDWKTVSRFADNQGITVFGVRPVLEVSGPRVTDGSVSTDGWLLTKAGDTFGSMCASTGGLVLDGDASKGFLTGQVQRLMSFLRNRYIIEFPRPANGSPGYYSIDVKIGNSTAIVRPSGVSFPPRERDPEQPQGTVPSDTSRLPLVGTKKQGTEPSGTPPLKN